MPIKIENLSFTYQAGSQWAYAALKSITLEIHAGEMVALYGETGSGKSTLLQLMNALLIPQQGRVLIDGVDTGKARGVDLQRLRRKAGLLFQYPEEQMFELKVFDEVAFGPGNLGLDRLQIKQKVREALELVGLSLPHYQNRPLNSLSSGEKKKIALAGILALEPDYLLLDEPMAGLDAGGREQVREVILHMQQKKNTAIIATSHSLQDFLEVADRIIILQRGGIFLDVSPVMLMDKLHVLPQAGLNPTVSMEVIHLLQNRGWPLENRVRNIEETAQEIARVIKGE